MNSRNHQWRQENQEAGTEAEDYYVHHSIKVDEGQEPLRIDKFLMNRLPNVSRSKIQAAAGCECIRVDGKAVKNNYKVRPGEMIQVVLPEPPRDKDVKPENIPINILYEDDDLIVVNKQAGMVVHPAYANFSGTLVNAMLFHFQKGNAGDLPRAGLIHRLDKDTSGILVMAKNDFSLTFLARQFFDHSIERKYIALVWGIPDNDEGIIKSFLGRDPKDRKKIFSFKDPEKGKEAITHYRVIEKFDYTSLIECRLETGRTHQIRVHLSSIGHPVFGDETYGGRSMRSGPSFTKYKQFVENCFGLLNRQALHAQTLGFIHPSTRQFIRFESELPDDMKQVIEKWRSRQILY